MVGRIDALEQAGIVYCRYQQPQVRCVSKGKYDLEGVHVMNDVIAGEYIQVAGIRL